VNCLPSTISNCTQLAAIINAHTNFSEQVGTAVTLYTRIRRVLGSILGPDTGYPD
jgi:hypothetical protein